MKNGKCGFIDKNNNVIVPIIYDSAGRFNEIDSNNSCGKKLAKVVLNGKQGLIDINGKIDVPIKYDMAVRKCP